jgi:hypothetical protein
MQSIVSTTLDAVPTDIVPMGGQQQQAQKPGQGLPSMDKLMSQGKALINKMAPTPPSQPPPPPQKSSSGPLFAPEIVAKDIVIGGKTPSCTILARNCAYTPTSYEEKLSSIQL